MRKNSFYEDGRKEKCYDFVDEGRTMVSFEALMDRFMEEEEQEDMESGTYVPVGGLSFDDIVKIMEEGDGENE